MNQFLRMSVKLQATAVSQTLQIKNSLLLLSGYQLQNNDSQKDSGHISRAIFLALEFCRTATGRQYERG